MLLADLVAATEAVAATSSRTAKAEALAELLRGAGAAEAAVVARLAAGDPRQGRIGVGWATVAAMGAEPDDPPGSEPDGPPESEPGSEPASPSRTELEHEPADPSGAESRSVPVGSPGAEPGLSVADLDSLLDAVADTSGPGSAGRRTGLIDGFLARATLAEARFLRRLLVGELRQGAGEGIVVEAVARAAGVPATAVRRALMLSGDLGAVAETAMTGGRAGLEAVGLELFRPIRPMLASAAPSAEAAVSEMGRVSVEWKLDGIRVQVHRRGDTVRIWTRNLNEVTDRLPEVVKIVRSLPVQSAVLDGELAVLDDHLSPGAAFQDTMSRFGADDADDGSESDGAGSDESEPDADDSPDADDNLESAEADSGEGRPAAERSDADGTDEEADRAAVLRLTPMFFDLVHRDGADLLDEPLERRLEHLAEAAAGHRIPGTVTDDPDEAAAVFTEAVGRGHEGVVVKAADSAYAAGRRGKAWRKVKPVHTLDLVVLAVEPGSGRRRGWLSNIHLGARGPDGGFVMVGKTFKGMTDEILEWQTRRFEDLAVSSERYVTRLRPEQVVEVAVDGVQRSSRYPGGVALRFARVVRYRSDKPPAEADTIEAVRRLL